MPPIKIETCGYVFTSKEQPRGVRVVNTDLGIAYIGNENGGRVVFARKINEHQYNNKEPIIVHQGEDPITKEIECNSIGGQKRTVVVKITAF